MEIIAENLCKKYKNLEALKGVSFEVKKGEIFGFLGPNGAGKTTTIKILTTQILPDKGRALVGGIDVVKNPNKVKSKIGVVFEDQNFYPRLTVYQNLIFFANLYSKNKKRVDEVLSFVNLSHRKKDEAQKLSRGLKQRLLIARSLLPDPEIIFLDEPTVGLDPHIAREIRNLFKNLKEKGKTILLTTHYMEEADELCDRIAIIDAGKIVAMDTPENLKDKLGKTKILITITHKNGQQEERIFSNEKDMLNFLKNINTKELTFKINVKKPSLEDVFVKLTGKPLE